MIDIRRKKQAFHETIRNTQRNAFRKVKREKFAQQQEHKEFLKALKQPFSFCLNWQEEKHDFWTYGRTNPECNYSCPFDFIDTTCQNLKDLLLRFQTDTDSKLEISQILIENLPFLIPPRDHQLEELPKSFIELCMFVLKNPQHDIYDKENFVDSLPHETIIRCLVKYFVENWPQIKANKCNDILMSFFVQYNRHKNVFSQSMYFDQNYDFLLFETIKEITSLTSAQIHSYNNSNTILSYLQNEHYETIIHVDSSYNDLSDQERISQVIKYANFLSNLLLLSPRPNFSIKQLRNKLKTIASYLHRKILLNQYDFKYRISAEFSVSILLGFLCETQLDKEVQITTTILNSQIKRIESIRYRNNSANEDFEIDQVVPSKYKNLDGDDVIETNDTTYNWLNRMSLFMVSNMAKNSVNFKYKHVEKWLNYQMRLKEKNVFKLENSNIIKCLLSLLRTLIKNQHKCPETYKSYSYKRQRTNEKRQEVFRIKASICKIIGKKGFQQLLKNPGMKEYNKEFCHFLCTMMDGIDKLGDIYGIVVNLPRFESEQSEQNFQQSIDCDHGEEKEKQGELNSEQNEQNSILSAIRVFIFKLSVDFLSKTYKYLPYKEKEELMLHLVNSDNLSGEDTGKYLTLEERQKFKKYIQLSWEDCNSDNEQYSNDSEEYDPNEHHYQRFEYRDQKKKEQWADETKYDDGNSEDTII